jgi:ABC-2 type transport system ATP-binding protein
MSIINVENLSKTFTYTEKEEGLKYTLKNLIHPVKKEKNAVKSVSFQVDEGEIVGFLGPNGAGKTTTLKMLSGILHPTSGAASILGYTPWERKNDYKRQFSIVMGQKNQLWWDLPANESLYLNKCIYEIEDKRYQEILNTLTSLLDIKDLLKVQVRRLSLGERMKMELVAALLHEPKVLFLDEPTIGLDLISQKNIREFIADYNTKNKTTILLTSHYMHDIEDLCKRTIVINQGEVIYDGSLSHINQMFTNQKIIKLQLETPARYCLPDLSLCQVKSREGNVITLSVLRNRVRQVAQALLDQYPVIDLTIEDIPLEEGIAYLYQKGLKTNE